MRMVARLLTALGIAALGADALSILESGATPYTLAWILQDVPDGSTQAASVVGRYLVDSPAQAVPASFVLLWIGAVLFILFPRRKPRPESAPVEA
ncbi:MAG: hypothetical protein AAGA88_02205 [Pseudomonadota bacterium]